MEEMEISPEFAGAVVYFLDIYRDPNVNAGIKIYLSNKLMNMSNREMGQELSDFKKLFAKLQQNDTIRAYHNKLLNTNK